MCDAFLMLAQTARGLSCFLVPRWRPDGVKNAMHLQRLKDKLGNRSNASSEVELDGAFGELVGEEGRGVPTIIEMVSHTRLDCCIGAAAGMRFGVAQALHHASHRAAFGKRLVDHALMQNVLADLGARIGGGDGDDGAAGARLRRGAAANPEARRFARLATAICKYWLCKRAAGARRRGAGVPRRQRLRRGVDDAAALSRCAAQRHLGRLGQRHLPRRAARDGEGPVVGAAVLRRGASWRAAKSASSALSARSPRELREVEDIEGRARRLVERMALTLQASLMVRTAPPELASAFLASRLDGDRGLAFGTLPRGTAVDAILQRAAVARC